MMGAYFYNSLFIKDDAVDGNSVVGSAEFLESLNQMNAEESTRTRYVFLNVYLHREHSIYVHFMVKSSNSNAVAIPKLWRI